VRKLAPTGTNRDEVAAQLRIAIARTSRRLRQEAGSGLTPSLSAVLGTVQRHGPLTPSELADREDLARPGVTRMIARLEELGLINRHPDPLDKRSYRIVTTAEADALLAAAQKRSKAYLSRALRGVDEEELLILERATAILERLLEDDR
jgi:DNA-binding MarR family transcriptional regulator